MNHYESMWKKENTIEIEHISINLKKHSIL